MRFFSFVCGNQPAIGVRTDDGAVDLSAAAPHLPSTLDELLAAGPEALQTAHSIARRADSRHAIAVEKQTLLPPLLKPGKIICLGLNYAQHASEVSAARPDFPVVFMRGFTSVVGPGAAIVRPLVSDQLDYEGELVAVIGMRARHVTVADAANVVAAYSVFNDGSIRDYQKKTHQWTLGKNFDGTGAFGPELVTADELPPGAAGLQITTRLNGDVVQQASTSEMIFGVFETVALLSQAMTLEPGDLLVMGTPSGVGSARKPPLWMKPGDVCEVEIERVGLLRNPIAQEDLSRTSRARAG